MDNEKGSILFNCYEQQTNPTFNSRVNNIGISTLTNHSNRHSYQSHQTNSFYNRSTVSPSEFKIDSINSQQQFLSDDTKHKKDRSRLFHFDSFIKLENCSLLDLFLQLLANPIPDIFLLVLLSVLYLLELL